MAVDILTNVLGAANPATPLGFLITLILSTVIGGAVFLLVLTILSKKFRDTIRLTNAFIVVFFINLVNMLGVLKLVPYINIVPALALQIIIWVLLTKLAFRGMKFSHAIIAGLIGWALASFVVPELVFLASVYVKF